MMRLDPKLCFLEKCGPPEDDYTDKNQDENSKLDDDDEEDR